MKIFLLNPREVEESPAGFKKIKMMRTEAKTALSFFVSFFGSSQKMKIGLADKPSKEKYAWPKH